MNSDEMNCGAAFVFGNESVWREGPATGCSSTSSCAGDKRARLFCGGCAARGAGADGLGADDLLAAGAPKVGRAGRAVGGGAAAGAGARATGVGAGGAGTERVGCGAGTAGTESTFCAFRSIFRTTFRTSFRACALLHQP